MHWDETFQQAAVKTYCEKFKRALLTIILLPNFGYLLVYFQG